MFLINAANCSTGVLLFNENEAYPTGNVKSPVTMTKSGFVLSSSEYIVFNAFKSLS